MIILDLDNCISDDGWRIPHIRWDARGQERYHDYHLLAPFDELGNAHLFANRAPASVAILTARPLSFRAATVEWLKRKRVPYTVLLMRPNADTRHGPAVKRDQLQWLFDYYEVTPESVECAYDDREDICAMYRAAGVRAVQISIHNTCAYTNPAERTPA